MHPRPALAMSSLALLLVVLATAMPVGADQETPAPAGGTPADPNAPAEAEAPAEAQEPAKDAVALTDRLTIRVGTAAFEMRASGRGTTEGFDRVGGLSLQQTTLLDFASTTGIALTIDARYKVHPRWDVAVNYMQVSPDEQDFTDERLLADFSGPGDFTVASFASTYEADFAEWGLGGVWRAWPGKKGADSRLNVDLVINYRKARVENTFDIGALVENPFEPPQFSAPTFDPTGSSQGNYDMNFETLSAGVDVGVKLGPNFRLSGVFEPTWFGRFEGEADLGGHGMTFVFNPFRHLDGRFHVPNCNNSDADLTNNCGLIDSDLLTPRLRVEQKANRVRGLRLDLNLDYAINDTFGLAAGYHRQDFRSSGGTEKRIFLDEDLAGCPSAPSADPNVALPGNCPNEQGDLNKAEVVTQTFYLLGRFRFW